MLRQSQILGSERLAADLARSNVATAGSLRRERTLRHLAQVRDLVAHDDVVRGEIADHAGDAAVARGLRHAGREHVEQLLRVVRTPFPAFEGLHQLGALDETARVDLELVGPEIRVIEETGEVLDVALRSRAEQVRHPVRVDLETGRAQCGECTPGRRDVVPAAIHQEHAIRETLDADLHLGAAQAADPLHLVRCDLVGPGLECKPDVAACGVFVRALRGFELGPGRSLRFVDELAAVRSCERIANHAVVASPTVRASVDRRELPECDARDTGFGPAVDARPEVVHRIEAAFHVPDLVRLGMEGPGAAEDDQLDLVDRVPDAVVGGQPVPGLEVGVEAVDLRRAVRRARRTGSSSASARRSGRRCNAPGTDRAS